MLMSIHLALKWPNQITMQTRFHLNHLKHILKNKTTITSALFKLRLGYSVFVLQWFCKTSLMLQNFHLHHKGTK